GMDGLAKDLEAIIAGERGSQSQELVDRHSQRVNVRSAVEWGPSPDRLLGAHIPGRAQSVPRVGQVQAASHPRKPEVGDPEFAFVVNHEIRGLDISMKDVGGMSMVERKGGLPRNPGHFAEEVGSSN